MDSSLLNQPWQRAGIPECQEFRSLASRPLGQGVVSATSPFLVTGAKSSQGSRVFLKAEPWEVSGPVPTFTPCDVKASVAGLICLHILIA